LGIYLIKHFFLRLERIFDSLTGDFGHAVEFTFGKRRAFRGSLDLDEFSRGGLASFRAVLRHGLDRLGRIVVLSAGRLKDLLQG
jgi:hypothetical protein